jgi:hypothetical protein
VRVKVAVSDVNPAGWKARRDAKPGEPLAFPQVLIRFLLERTADADDAVQDGAVGKVLIDIG